jgi:hypothetical protein
VGYPSKNNYQQSKKALLHKAIDGFVPTHLLTDCPVESLTDCPVESETILETFDLQLTYGHFNLIARELV